MKDDRKGANFGQMDLQIMSADRGYVVSSVRCILDEETALSGDLVPPDTPQHFSALSSEHWPNN